MVRDGRGRYERRIKEGRGANDPGAMSIFGRPSRQDILIEAGYAMDTLKPNARVEGIRNCLSGGLERKLKYKRCSLGVGHLLLQCY